MKHFKKIYLLPVLLPLLLFASCAKEDYIHDGGISKAEVNMTTYDYLSSKPQFSSLVKLIDRAGLKDVVNGDITFFAVDNYGVDDWVSAKKQQRIIELNDENITYTIDSIPVSYFKDSLLTYLFSGKINRDKITVAGALYNSLMGENPSVKYLIKFRRAYDFSNYLDYVDYVNFTKVTGSRDDLEPAGTNIPQEELDRSVDCQSAGIITTTGIVHILASSHRLFFNTQPMASQ